MKNRVQNRGKQSDLRSKEDENGRREKLGKYICYLRDFGCHLVKIGLVFAEAINHLAEEEEENGHGRAMDNGAESAEDHKKAVVFVCEREELEERKGVFLFLFRFG